MNGYVVNICICGIKCEYILFYTKDNTWKFKAI